MTTEEQGWISVTDKLPEGNEILFTDGVRVMIGYYWEYDKSFSGNAAGCYDDKWQINEVTHWMPLPKLPIK